MSNNAAVVLKKLNAQLHKMSQKDIWKQALSTGFANAKDEHWRYTKLDKFYQLDFCLSTKKSISIDKVHALALTLDCYLVVFVNGYYQPLLSSQELGSYSITDINGQFEEAINSEIFQLINESFSVNAQQIRLPKNKIETKPLLLLHINNAQGKMTHSYHQLSIESGAQGVVIEQFVNLDSFETAQFNGARCVFNIADNASLDHYKVCVQENSYHFSHNDFHLGRDTKVRSLCFLLSGDLIRHHTSSRLKGENSHLSMHSLSLPKGKQTYDSRTYLEHQATYCQSLQIHKFIVQDQAVGVFNGMIKVAKDAIKTDAQMQDHNLLLSDTCQINSKPQLEIYADDVKCSHGCTTGTLNKEQIFYMQSRGISQKRAKKILTLAFAMALTDLIKVSDLKDFVVAHIDKNLSEVKI
ncbi:Iron-regulated ABC transporter permease protein SufD [Psychromonas sp. CNPT3]|uniref:Fe-S cluster assembly protein SufD n=1 Tax=Psychromonas sp. CNPT3 TaxID=314282 RepID=UPI00006E8AC5|nr:Fe-S cluster assembly protein SufD [Psychromonas sp. CNPT3]AGH80495.1 Iron-regulated ABC transporter permease protein SufD [Psychromonas sp. CNPT3]